MHRTLERQIKRHLGTHTAFSAEWTAFLDSVSRTYTDLDEDRDLLNRTFELSSKEFMENNLLLEETRKKVAVHAKDLAREVAERTKELAQRIRELEDARKAMTNLLEDYELEQRALANANAKNEALLESMGEGVIATDLDAKVVIMSKVALQLLGLTREEMTGKSILETFVIYDADGVRVTDILQPISLTLTLLATSTSADYMVSRKDGATFPAVITTSPVLLDGKMSGVIVVFRDITKEKEIEKLRVDFLSLASHQLRTPLSGTKWLIETIQRGIIGALNPKQKVYLDHLFQINERMIRLVADMLNILMIESGSAQVKMQEVAVHKIYEELELMVEPVSRTKGITLTNAFKDRKALVVIESDPQILRSILESFVGNAINYSLPDQAVVFDAQEAASTVIFSVTDSGIGIPQNEQKRIFERFYRASNAKRLKPDGTGLGLYTAFILAQKIGAKISFESMDGSGTTFYLQVPKTVNRAGSKHITHNPKS